MYTVFVPAGVMGAVANLPLALPERDSKGRPSSGTCKREWLSLGPDSVTIPIHFLKYLVFFKAAIPTFALDLIRLVLAGSVGAKKPT